MLLGGANMKVAGATDAFLQLADASQYAVAMTPDAKVRHHASPLSWAKSTICVKQQERAVSSCGYPLQHIPMPVTALDRRCHAQSARQRQ